MNLSIAYGDFAREVKERLPFSAVYLDFASGAVILTAGDVAQGFTLSCVAPLSAAMARSQLEAEGIEVRSGRWSVPGDSTIIMPHIAAIAFRSDESKPGLWVEAYPFKPTPGHALGRMYEEFVAEGLLKNTSLDDFLRQADPNVVILDPEEISTFMGRFAEGSGEPATPLASLPNE